MDELCKKLTALQVEAIYHETASDCRKCSTCLKLETREEPLLTCAKCKANVYCSRECQVKDWSNHKSVCQTLLPPSHHHENQCLAQTDARFAKFKFQYEQMLMHLTFWAMTTPLKKGKEDTGDEPYILLVELEDLEVTCPQPRFGIKSYHRVPLNLLPVRLQEQWLIGWMDGPSRMGPCFRRFELCLLGYNSTNLERPYLSAFPFNYDAVRLPYPGMNRSLEEQAIRLRMEADKYAAAINDMAKGNAKALKKATKLKTSPNGNTNNKKKKNKSKKKKN